jgi:cytochrome c-type biogenesis protein CcmE
MLSKKVKLRIVILALSFLLAISIIILVLQSLEKNLVYFFSPTEIYNRSDITLNKKIRVGGMVKKDSTKKEKNNTTFIITDFKNEIIVSYDGSTPNLFSEGKGVVAEGKLKDKKFFVADKILAKHDENYMPPEVNDILKKSE